MTRLALRAASSGTFLWDLVTREVIWSDELAQIHGLSPGSFTVDFETWNERVHEDDLPAIERDAVLALSRDRYTSSEYRIRRWGDDAIRWHQSHTLLIRDAAGQPVRITGITVDITERKEMEDALRAALERQRVTFEEAAIGMAEVSLDGAWLQVNARLCEILLLRRDAIVGRTVEELTHPDDRAHDAEQLSELVSTRRSSVAMEKRLRRSDGSYVWTFTKLALVRRLDGAPDYFIAAVEDITARRQAEDEVRALHATLERRVDERTTELQAVNEELEKFSYSVSHAVDDEARDSLQRVQAAAARMGALIDDLLQLSRVTRSPVRRVEVDLSAVVASVRASLVHEGARCVRWEISPGVTARVDPGLAQIALDNLVRNAWKFTRENPEARIAFGAEERDGERVYFVRDNGVGFALDHAKNLFEPFHRLHPPRQFEGSGVGLATVRRIVHRHGGRIWADSRPDEGATFFFTLEPSPARSPPP